MYSLSITLMFFQAIFCSKGLIQTQIGEKLCIDNCNKIVNLILKTLKKILQCQIVFGYSLFVD